MSFLDIKAWFVRRLPGVQQLAAVYGVIVLVVYGWTIYWYLWKLPSWLYYLTLDEILVALAYSMMVNFLESILVLLVPIVICLILPSRWFRDRFVARGAFFVILFLFALMWYLGTITALQDIPSSLRWMVPLAAAGIAILVFLVGRITILRKIMEEIANRATIFLYIFIPLSVISILVVLIRNLLRL